MFAITWSHSCKHSLNFCGARRYRKKFWGEVVLKSGNRIPDVKINTTKKWVRVLEKDTRKDTDWGTEESCPKYRFAWVVAGTGCKVSQVYLTYKNI